MTQGDVVLGPLDELLSRFAAGELSFRDFRLQLAEGDLLLGTQFEHLCEGVAEDVGKPQFFTWTQRFLDHVADGVRGCAGECGVGVYVVLDRVHRECQRLAVRLVHQVSPRSLCGASSVGDGAGSAVAGTVRPRK